MKNYFSIPQAAKICSVDRSTVNRWVTAGKIKSYSTPGGHKRILFKDLKLFLEKNKMPIKLNEFEEKKTKILIVDDDIDIQEYLTMILSGIFTSIQVASDGFEAGIKVMEFKPHLVILDLSMPKVDGFDVCKAIKENPSTCKIKILILTGYGTKENQTKAISLGADAFLTKPCTKTELIHQVEKLLK
jgi:excisionase family DNA binding protein